MGSDNKDKDTGYAVNQIKTSISNQNNFLFNELQYVDLIVDDTSLSATLDSGVNSVIIYKKGGNHVGVSGGVANSEKQIDEWLEQGIVRESCSDFLSPVVMYKRKDGTMRLCIDYRKLNKKIIKDRYPLPIIEEVLDKLRNGKIFTTLDLRNAFFHVDVDEASRKYTAFVTETGQYEFSKVPFGLSISILTRITSFKEGAKLELHTDACKLGLGAILLQQGEDGRFYPIHYMSKKTSIQEEKLCSYELEVLAVIEALKKFRNYLLGRKFRIQTDCAAFAKTLDKKELTPKILLGGRFF
ncbi:hypothetical protein TNCV_1909481 [Trichonephila clavipes]|nr:hypothetical protein TNCV_1909481 [Trichonephila clavipes]